MNVSPVGKITKWNFLRQCQVQWMPLNEITLGQTITDHINRIITVYKLQPMLGYNGVIWVNLDKFDSINWLIPLSLITLSLYFYCEPVLHQILEQSRITTNTGLPTISFRYFFVVLSLKSTFRPKTASLLCLHFVKSWIYLIQVLIKLHLYIIFPPFVTSKVNYSLSRNVLKSIKSEIYGLTFLVHMFVYQSFLDFIG